MNLLMNVGHGTSCLLMDDNGNVINGIEEERLIREKYASQYPINAINYVTENVNLKEIKNIFITHWFNDFDFPTKINIKNYSAFAKYFNINYFSALLRECNENVKIHSLDKSYTHHHAHRDSVIAFYENFEELPNDFHVFALDGFGNNEAVGAIYKYKNKKPYLTYNITGYNNSLGLFYQYATSYCGMKENQDEYKFLAYESHIKSILSDTQLNILLHFADKYAKSFLEKILVENNSSSDNSSLPIINKDALAKTKKTFYNLFDSVIEKIMGRDSHIGEFATRAIIGCFIQNVIEQTHILLIKEFRIETLLVAGGIYYNVKLNNTCMKHVKKFCVTPLAGDIGALAGIYYKHFGVFNYDSLCFAKRNISVDDINSHREFLDNEIYDNIVICHSEDEAASVCAELIAKEKVPQLVYSNGEFGPRALMHTSTLINPKQRLVTEVNKANDRVELMPCAPVIKYSDANYFFSDEDLDKVVGSHFYMIITYDFKNTINQNIYDGVMHLNPYTKTYTGRPQFVKQGSLAYSILDRVRQIDPTSILAIVNTSFNVHGVPIVSGVSQAISDFEFQFKHNYEFAKENMFLVFVVNDEKGE